MIKNLLKKFSTVLYVQVWEKKIKVTNISTGELFEEKALVAIRREEGKETVEAVGNNASLITDKSVTIIEPFVHQRVLLSNFTMAEILFRHAFEFLLHKALFGPRVVVHPMEKIDGGLSQVETQAFVELALSAGAIDAFVYEGTPLVKMGFDYEKIKLESKQINSLQKINIKI